MYIGVGEVGNTKMVCNLETVDISHYELFLFKVKLLTTLLSFVYFSENPGENIAFSLVLVLLNIMWHLLFSKMFSLMRKEERTKHPGKLGKANGRLPFLKLLVCISSELR